VTGSRKKTLSSLRSRWRTRWEWQKARAAATWPRTTLALASGIAPLASSTSRRLPPEQYSMTMLAVQVILQDVSDLDDPVSAVTSASA